MRKLFGSWKSYLLVALAFWMTSVLLAGSVVGNAVMAATAIPLVLATIYIAGGVLGKSDRDELMTRGRENLVVGIVLYVLLSVVLAMVNGNAAPGHAVQSLLVPTGVMIFSLIVAGIVCLIRGALLPTAERERSSIG